MGQSLVKNYVHIIFSTKNREKLIFDEIENELYAYLGGICKNMECNPVQIGGYKNHVHILCLLSKKVALMKLVEEIKSHSSKWIKTKDERLSNFYWQAGYGTFSVNPANVDVVKKYILNQKQHHTEIAFENEYKAFLEKNRIEYDKRYVWD